ncbi:MAG TPA: hypothetical protein PLN40_14350 [Agitococcus sp.]|nr:hypothetical protein [Agitococcus sp.]
MFVLPQENEFIDRGFNFSQEHDLDEAVISYVRTYQDDFELKITFDIGLTSSVYVSLLKSKHPLSQVTVECIEDISFQSWNGERILRFSDVQGKIDLRIHYEPKASIYLSSLSSGY